jgi:glutamate racemase
VLSKLRPELVVLACNTASVTALESLRARFDVPFIGVVPAVKPAARASAGRRIGVLSTSGTARAGYLSDLIAHHADGCAVELFPAADLVDWVETQMPLDGDGGSMDLLEHSISSIRAARIDQLVLGCTHFLYLKRTLQRALGESVQVVDSTDGVARQVRRVMGDLAAAPGRDRLYVTAEGTWQDRYLQAASSFSFAYAGVL